MSALLDHFDLSAPYFVLVLVGYLLSRSGRFPRAVSDALAAFVFAVAVPSLLFRLMSDPSRLPPFDARLLVAFFGGCLLTFVVGRMVSAWLFRLDGVGQSIFGLGGIFSNNVLLGIPLAKVILGEAALPPVALVVVFNSLTLWTLVTVSVEWARHGEFSLAGFTRTARNVLATPVVAAILSGAAFGLTGWHLPGMVDEPLRLMGQAAAPLALVVVGMGLAEYGLRSGFGIGAGMTVLKLLVQPLAVWGLAHLLGLPRLETQAVVLLASLAAGVNVYLMSKQFDTLQGPVATCLVLSTAFSAVTTPLAVALAGYVGFP
jgi:malonate transporter